MIRAEQLGTAADASIGAVFLVVDVLACERPLGAFLLGDVILLVAESRAQIGVVGFCRRSWVLLSRASRRIKFEQQRVHAADVVGRVVELTALGQQCMIEDDM